MEQQPGPVSAKRLLIYSLPLLMFIGLISVFFFQLTSGRDTSELPSALIGKPVPQFDLPPLAGLKRDGVEIPGLKSDELKGQISLVNIFASWCAPCRAEHPVLMSLAQHDQLKLVGINYQDKGENALRFLGALGNPFSNVGVDPKGRIAIDWGFYGIPESLLVDSNGNVRHKVVGPITADKLEVLLAKIKKLQEE